MLYILKSFSKKINRGYEITVATYDNNIYRSRKRNQAALQLVFNDLARVNYATDSTVEGLIVIGEHHAIFVCIT